MLVAHLVGWDEAHINEGFELDVGGGLGRVEIEVVGLVVAFTLDLDHVVEVAFAVGFKLDV